MFTFCKEHVSHILGHMFTCCRPHRLDPAGQLGIRLSGASAAFHPWKNIKIGFVNFSLLNTPCLELIGTVPGSAITTMPTISWCSWNNVCEGRGLFRSRWKKLDLIQSTSRTTLVTSGTRSRASFSPPSSSATTTSRFVHVNTALQRICLWNRFLLLNTISHHSAIFLCALRTEFSMSMGWYLMPRRIKVSSRAPTTNTASWCSEKKED